MPELIDIATPKSAKTCTSFDSKEYVWPCLLRQVQSQWAHLPPGGQPLLEGSQSVVQYDQQPGVVQLQPRVGNSVYYWRTSWSMGWRTTAVYCRGGTSFDLRAGILRGLWHCLGGTQRWLDMRVAFASCFWDFVLRRVYDHFSGLAHGLWGTLRDLVMDRWQMACPGLLYF